MYNVLWLVHVRPAHNNSRGPCKKDVGHPCRRPLFLFYEAVFPESFEGMECWSIEFVVSVFTAKSSPSEGLSIGVQLTLATA